MSNSDTATIEHDQWPDRQLTEAQQKNRDAASLIPVKRSGTVLMDFSQMVDYAKFMSTARGAVGTHLMGNVGGCLAVMEIANQFGLPMYAVARQSYLVNGRIAFMGQFFHSIIEDYAPLKKGANGRKLQFKYDGEGETLKITVSGTFEGATEAVTYESPMLKDIKTQNSPLWKSEPRRQLIYFGVRGWQTINWSEGMMHAISEDEAAALPPSEYARDVTPIKSPEADGLRARLAAAQAEHPEGTEREGFKEGFTEGHFTEAKDTQSEQTDAAVEQTIAAATAEPAKAETVKPPKAAAKNKKAKAAPEAPAEPAIEPPKNAEAWAEYAMAWLKLATDAEQMRKRWADEQKLRNAVGVTSEIRDPVFTFYQQRLIDIEGE